MTAPDGSVTVPVIVPRSPWPQATLTSNAQQQNSLAEYFTVFPLLAFSQA